MARYSPSAVPSILEPPELKVYLDQEFRRVAGSQPDEELEGVALIGTTADDVVANDATETAMVNFGDSFVSGVIAADPLLGTITLPARQGIVAVTTWVSLNQVTANRDFTLQLKLEVDAVWQEPILATGYLPQQGSDVHLGLSASFSRSVTGGEILRFGLLLDNEATATFQILDSSFEVQYLTVRG